MENQIEASIKTLTKKITASVTSHEALQFTQAALNLAHVAQVLKQVKTP